VRYLSVCSGIEAATVAWHHMGWQPVAFSDIEAFPSAVLAHHYPHVPNLGDMTKFEEWNLEPVDLLVGGTPCQSFSVAGLRKGLADPRGNLMLTFLAIAQRHRPRWIVWENVPGVLSSNGGRDFGAFLGALGELGYGFAYRVLDAQWFGVAQRRRRVFVVGHLGSWQRAAAVLFERESVRRDIAPSREKGQEIAASTRAGVANSGSWWDGSDVAATLTKQNANGAQRMPDKDNFGAVLQPVTQLIGFYSNLGYQGGGFEIGVSPTTKVGSVTAVATSMQVRRLTPIECERLQGFPDNYTNIPWRKKDKSPDGPRYKALGNSMAVPVMRWIGERIERVSKNENCH
jgi:DNA (cytosine-5)-methyltransferase 1